MLTIQERLEMVDQCLNKASGLVLRDPLKPGTLRNKVFGGACTGYRFQLNNLSYRGVWLSTIEFFQLTVDGERVPSSDIRICLDHFSCTPENLCNNTDVFWGCMDKCYVDVNRVGGLAPGEHTFVLELKKRLDFGHSYGEGTENYEDAVDLMNPTYVRHEQVYTV